MEPASEGGKNPAGEVGLRYGVLAAMEPAPEGGKNPARAWALPPPATLPQWSPPRKAGRTPLARCVGAGRDGAAMEPAPEGGKNLPVVAGVLVEELAAMEPAPEGGTLIVRVGVHRELAAMEPAPEGGKNFRCPVRCLRAQPAARSQPRKAGRTRAASTLGRAHRPSRNEPAPEGGKNLVGGMSDPRLVQQAAMEPAPAGGRNLDRRGDRRPVPDAAAMEPAPKGGRNLRPQGRVRPGPAPAMEPAPKGGRNLRPQGRVRPGPAPAMEPAPEGGRNRALATRLVCLRVLPQCSPPRKAGGPTVLGGAHRRGLRPAMEPAPVAGETRPPNVPPLTCPFERERSADDMRGVAKIPIQLSSNENPLQAGRERSPGLDQPPERSHYRIVGPEVGRSDRSPRKANVDRSPGSPRSRTRMLSTSCAIACPSLHLSPVSSCGARSHRNTEYAGSRRDLSRSGAPGGV